MHFHLSMKYKAKGLAPINGAEAAFAEVDVVEAERPPTLGLVVLGKVAQAWEVRIAARPEVLDRHRMLALHAQRERDVGARDVVVPAAAGAGDLADEEVAPGEVERGRIAEDQAQREQALGGEPGGVVGVR